MTFEIDTHQSSARMRLGVDVGIEGFSQQVHMAVKKTGLSYGLEPNCPLRPVGLSLQADLSGHFSGALTGDPADCMQGVLNLAVEAIGVPAQHMPDAMRALGRFGSSGASLLGDASREGWNTLNAKVNDAVNEAADTASDPDTYNPTKWKWKP